MTYPPRAPAHERRCMFGHAYSTADTSTHYVTAKGNVRYVCPVCRVQPGWKLPRGWKAEQHQGPQC